MRRVFVIGLIVVVVIGGLMFAAKARAPKPAPPSTSEIWNSRGVPIETAVISAGNMEQTVEVTGNITALDKVTLSAKIAGRITAVYAREGDTVKAGQVIVALDQQDTLRQVESAEEGLQAAIARLSQAKTTAKVTKIQTDAAIEQAISTLKSAQARLAVAKNPARSQDKMVAENRVAAAKASLDNKEADYKRNKTLVDKGAISQATFELAATQYTIAKTDLKSAQDQLDLIKEGGRNEDVISAQAAVDQAEEGVRTAKANAAQNLLRVEDVKSAAAAVGQAQAAVSLARQQLSYTYIKAPISGEVSSRTTDPGQVVSPGQPLLDVVNMGSVYLKGDVSEREITNVTPGQRVNVKVDAMPDRQFAGTVAEVYPSGSEQNRNFSVRIAITDKNPAIKPGMFARGEVVTGVHNNVLLIPKDAIDQRGGTSMVFVVSDDTEALKALQAEQAKLAKQHKKTKPVEMPKKAKRYNVTVLHENSEHVEIASPNGLTAGDVVVTAGRQNLQDNTKVLLSK